MVLTVDARREAPHYVGGLRAQRDSAVIVLAVPEPTIGDMADPYQTLSTLYLRGTEFIARHLERDEEGQGMVEYALILVLIAIVVIVIISTVGKRVNNVFSNISNGLAR